MLDEISKKYIITIILAVLVAAIAAAGFGIWRLAKKDESAGFRQPTSEELIKSLSAPAATAKTTQKLTPEEKKVIDSLTAPIKNPSIPKKILDTLSAPEI